MIINDLINIGKRLSIVHLILRNILNLSNGLILELMDYSLKIFCLNIV